jgi:hypothetical protein
MDGHGEIGGAEGQTAGPTHWQQKQKCGSKGIQFVKN